MTERKPIKVGVVQGGGLPPGYKWNVLIYDAAFKEALSFLADAQYQHLAMQFKELAREDDPSHSNVTDVQSIDDFYELRDKGGVLGKTNVRVFFGLEKQSRSLVVLGCIKKERNGGTNAFGSPHQNATSVAKFPHAKLMFVNGTMERWPKLWK